MVSSNCPTHQKPSSYHLCHQNSARWATSQFIVGGAAQLGSGIRAAVALLCGGEEHMGKREGRHLCLTWCPGRVEELQQRGLDGKGHVGGRLVAGEAACSSNG